MKIGGQVEIASVHLRERRRGGSTTSEKDRHFEFVTWGCDHDVSILIAVGGGGRYRGVEPRLKVSMTLMRPPQHGQGWGGLSVAAALSGGCCLCAVCAGVAAAISSRARAMVSVLVPLASSPQCLIRWNP